MIYSKKPLRKIEKKGIEVNSFIDDSKTNIDWDTVKSFGDEWTKFDTFSTSDINTIGSDYFDIVPFDQLPANSNVLDIGCGSGRWIQYLYDKVGNIEAIDPSEAVFVAAKTLSKCSNVRISHADVENIPFEKNSFDLVYSLGVLHHIPDTKKALKRSSEMVKKGGFLLLYLYYNLDNRSSFYKALFSTSNLVRRFISKQPQNVKKAICDLIAYLVYWPLILFSKFLDLIYLKKWSEAVPLSYYKKTSNHIIRNDALDRFGTPLEQRFSKIEIQNMMEEVGLRNIVFSENPPYWHAIGKK